MKIIQPPKNRVACKTCKAVIEFDYNDVQNGRKLSKRGGIYKYVECPCCKSIVRVWEDGMIESDSESKLSPFYGLGGSI